MKKSYYAIIPADVRYDRNLTDGAKLLYGEITALCNEKGYCWASNGYFADLYGVTKVTISRWIKSLIDQGYIESKLNYKEGSKEIDSRYIQICCDPINKNDNTPINKNVKENNTKDLNNTSNIPYVEIVTYLNGVAGKQYRHSTRKTKDLIKSRWNEGFKLNDFKKVIDIKTLEWKDDKKMNQYLRPETLFGTKFESYLNQEIKESDSDSQFDGLF